MLLLDKTLIRLAKGLWGWIIAIVILKLFSLTALTYFAKTIAQYLGNIDAANMTLQAGLNATLVAFIAAVVQFFADMLVGEGEHQCNAKARISLRQKIFSKVLELDVGNVDKIGPVAAIASSVDGVEAMLVYYSKYLPSLIYCCIAPFYLFYNLKSVSFPVAIILLIISVLILPLNNIFRNKIEKAKTGYWATLEDLTGYYLESVRGITTFKLFGQDGKRQEVLSGKTKKLSDSILGIMKINFISFFLTDGFIYFSVVITLVTALIQLGTGAISFSESLVVLMLSFSFFNAVRSLMSSTHTAMQGVAAAEKLEVIFDIDTSRAYNPERPISQTPYDGIKIDNVSFSYVDRDATLKNVSLKIPRRKMTALVGLSGCGKSTIANLLMRFYDYGSGCIELEGTDITALKPSELRKRIIMVPQTVNLFSGTVAENLRLADENASDEKLFQVLKDVRLLDWVNAQADGLATEVGDAGAKLSGGQRQKIGIARALLSGAEYIIFDEATSSVDIESEHEIWNCINELALTRTLIVISHRLSTISMADNIYVLERGTVAESGTHQQLMEKNGIYKKMTEEQELLENKSFAGKGNGK